MMLLVVLAFLSTDCRNSNPPPIDICLGDGFGGADCVLKDGSRSYLAPSKLANYWMTPQNDEAAFASWCYDTSQSNVRAQMSMIKKAAR